MPDNRRMKRIESMMIREIARIVGHELKDPIFEGKVISFPDISVSRDLSVANVRVSVFEDSTDNGVLEAIVAKLNEVSPMIRKMIMDNSDLRKIPAFNFHEDHTIEKATRIETILDELDIPPEDENSETE